MGDDTALRDGRITLNPLAHIDPIGTVLIPLIMFLFSGTGIRLIGWAKPTPVGAHNFKKLARGHILVAGAGPVSNLLLGLLFALVLFVAVRVGMVGHQLTPLRFLLETGIHTNVVLAVFNLVPIPPLDGSWIASWGLPRSMAAYYDRFMEPYGFLILLILFYTHVLDYVIWPPARFLAGLLLSIAD
jgi:Zn-dependent protease